MSLTPKPRIGLRPLVIGEAQERAAVRDLEDWADARRRRGPRLVD
ncbi:MAG TPA: hypothetical protein VI818_04700 [Candidatus Thermoplasmatota archaeon]|nr:hypothetical protein [Candidatus Thermoplasmatota archaeon]